MNSKPVSDDASFDLNVDSSAVPEFGPIASLILAITVVSVIIVTARTRKFIKL